MLTLLNLLSAVALLIWGTHIVRTGILRVYGTNLRHVIGQNMSRRWLAFIAGILVTAMVQSSNATAMLVTSFVGQGLMALTPALVTMLGADVGTALMARVLTFDLSWLSPLLIFLGVGTVLIAESFDVHVPKGYVYFAMGFSLAVEAINIKLRGAMAKKKKQQDPVKLRKDIPGQ